MDVRPILGALVAIGSVFFGLWVLRRVDAQRNSYAAASDAARLLLN
jgi:hypothetical protein